ncbi:unnamed protein product [Bursaphelenchus xylophilus]|uniref:(pine wood nematode) hypothetical protein n=1 Tax=Bursaphelenchus xylophilus TaxID=6326 RepID=A0A1I7RIX6_BURXY|nr:unnamed protein product [Bursaphelenchus xylophilus]CAG9119160.1 unnamed protein product [Bursaphelenchus xylophilus]
MPLAECLLYNRYVPPSNGAGNEFNRLDSTRMHIELLARYGCTPQVITTAAQLIKDSFNDDGWATTGDDTHAIGTGMEKAFGGKWMVGEFNAEFDVAYTIVRRSPTYMLFLVNKRHILIAKEGLNDRLNTEHIIF